MINGIKIKSIFVTLVSSLFLASNSTAAKPNFVIIFCDDMGYQDLECYGAPKGCGINN